MKLRRIEAEAFGALQGCALQDLGDGLTVVLGPNESGKSTYAALVRQVLYGYPDKRSKDLGYQPKAGGRVGRLVFDDAAGQWSIVRTEGARGGSVRVDAMRGAERPQLLSEVVGSITEQTFRVVFGFGLDELNDIESGTDKAVMDRLFAGSMGLSVNPMDARKALDEAAGSLFKVRGNAVVNGLLTQIRDVKAEIRDLEAQARDFAGDQAQLREMAERLEPLKARRDDLDRRVRETERAAERAKGLAESLVESVERGVQVASERDERSREAERTVVDEHLLKIAADLTAVLQEQSGAKQHAERARSLDSRAAELRRSAEALGVATTSTDTAEARSALDTWRDRRARLEADTASAARTAEQAEARARNYATAGADEEAGIPPRRIPVASWAVLGLGVLAGAAGALTGQWVATGLGVLAAVVGLAMLVMARGTRQPAPTLAAEALRLRADAQTASDLAAVASERLEAEALQWAQWLGDHELAERGVEPAAVASLLDDARRRAELRDQAAASEAEAERERAEAAAWAQRLVGLVRGPLGVSEVSPEPHALAIRAREALEGGQAARERKVAAALAAEAASAELERIAQKEARIAADLAAVASQYGIEGDVVAGLQAASGTLAQELSAAADAFEELAGEHAELVGRLGTQGRDDTLARARQRLEGMVAQAHSAADGYLVEALARELVDRARERFERDRQPEVVRTAARVFEAMTHGRYRSVRVPMGGESITVVSSSGDVLPTARLSRGTAEQLYLALRVGLIQSFGEQGPHLPVLMDDIVVNYDAERVRGASAAIAELASTRQVVFFTCHEATAAALASAVPGAKAITLDRCTL